MAQTTRVEIGNITFPISGPAAEALDEYNFDDDTFSPEDIENTWVVEGFDAKAVAVDILAKAISPYDSSMKNRISALIGLADKTDTLFRQVRRLAALSPRLRLGATFMGGDELEFDARKWKEVGGSVAMQSVVQATNAVGRELQSVQHYFPEIFHVSSADKIYEVGTLHYSFFQPVFEQLGVQLDETRKFFNVRFKSNRNEKGFCGYASDLECEGPGCPPDDEVTGDFCIPTFNLGD